MILPDTSVWIDYLGRCQHPKARWLKTQIKAGAKICTCLPILQEVLQGASSDLSFGRIRKQMENLAWVEIHDSKLSAILAARLYARLRWRGITIRSPNDCLIASIAIEHRLQLLHNDTDFDRIAAMDSRLEIVSA